jgi:nucleoside-diphosphate-sugar epimerase
MHSDSYPSVAVVGAAGFVGRELLRQLEQLEITATAIVRGSPEISVDGDFHVACSQPTALAGARFDIVVNLAYPTSGSLYEQPDLNAEIVRTVQELVKNDGRLIQVSSLAVFGLLLDRPVRPTPVPAARDHAYVESKVAAEHLFAQEQAQRGFRLDIVRLGNIWGYASATWALPVVHRLLAGRPVGIAGASGPSNTTDVANVAAYLAFLIQSEDHGHGVHYHHLAEFSSVPWRDWVEPIAAMMGVEPVYAAPSVLKAPDRRRREIAELLAPMTPRNLYKAMSDHRITGSLARTLTRQIPARARPRLKSDRLVFAQEPPIDWVENVFLSTLAGCQEFSSVICDGWRPRLTKDESLQSVLTWLAQGWEPCG